MVSGPQHQHNGNADRGERHVRKFAAVAEFTFSGSFRQVLGLQPVICSPWICLAHQRRVFRGGVAALKHGHYCLQVSSQEEVRPRSPRGSSQHSSPSPSACDFDTQTQKHAHTHWIWIFLRSGCAMGVWCFEQGEPDSDSSSSSSDDEYNDALEIGEMAWEGLFELVCTQVASLSTSPTKHNPHLGSPPGSNLVSINETTVQPPPPTF